MSDVEDRKSFLRMLSLGGMLGGAAFLVNRHIQSGGDCIGDNKCKVCLSVKKCDLPLAHEHRKTHNIQKEKFLDVPQASLKNKKGSLSQKRAYLRHIKEQKNG